MELRAHAALICPKTLMAKGKLLCTRPTNFSLIRVVCCLQCSVARAVCSVHCATNEHTFTVYTDVCVQRSASPVGIGGYWQFSCRIFYAQKLIQIYTKFHKQENVLKEGYRYRQ